MVNIQTVRRIAASLPETEDLSTTLALRFEVRGKGYAWSWHERVEPKRPRRPRLDVLAVRCPPEEKEAILFSDPKKFFTEDHYRGFPAVLARLDNISAKEMRALLTAAWRCQAPRALVKATMAKQRATRPARSRAPD
ncbi:MAG TPA: MmcQ/YjbR family DNA-binding protein [Roseiarcus sp.]|nr:MmcQ/YjbR family DNA-binding protein [Roseiarcus sp.]